METLRKHFREITRAAFARHGFAQADVVSNWTEIVGPELARHSAPERIRWPRQAGETGQKAGGTLIVRAAPGRAIDIQYEGPRIIARINGFFGYGAVTQIKVMQAAELAAKPLERPPPGDIIPVYDQTLEGMDSGPLKDALQRLGRGLAATRRSSPQDK